MVKAIQGATQTVEVQLTLKSERLDFRILLSVLKCHKNHKHGRWCWHTELRYCCSLNAQTHLFPCCECSMIWSQVYLVLPNNELPLLHYQFQLVGPTVRRTECPLSARRHSLRQCGLLPARVLKLLLVQTLGGFCGKLCTHEGKDIGAGPLVRRRVPWWKLVLLGLLPQLTPALSGLLLNVGSGVPDSCFCSQVNWSRSPLLFLVDFAVSGHLFSFQVLGAYSC